MNDRTFVGHLSNKNRISIPALIGANSLYFGNLDALAELDVLNANEDYLMSHIKSIAETIDPLDRMNGRTALVFKLGDSIVKLSSTGDALAEAVVTEGLIEGLDKTSTPDNDDVKIPRFIAGATAGHSSLLITEFIPDYSPVPEFGPEAVEEFTKTENSDMRLQRYFDAMKLTGLFDNLDVERWTEYDLIHYFDDALTNTLWPKDFTTEPPHVKCPKEYYRIDFGSLRIPRKDIVIA